MDTKRYRTHLSCFQQSYIDTNFQLRFLQGLEKTEVIAWLTRDFPVSATEIRAKIW